MTDRPQHAELRQFPVVNDELVIGGLPVRELAQRVGQTPFYAYDRSAISHRVRELREAMPEDLVLHYAIKANPMPAVIDYLASRVDGLDVASLGELRLALDSGVATEHISFAGPGKTLPELQAAISAGITINIESAGEFARIVALAEKTGRQPRVAVRVNPDFELKSSGMRMGGGQTPFGVDAEQVPALLKRIAQSDVSFEGFQIYAGSQNLYADRLIEAQIATFQLAYRLATHLAEPIKQLNIGGGFGVPYFPGDRHLELAPIGAALDESMADARKRLGDTKIVLELGRYLVAEAGVYVCSVVDKKISRGRRYLVADGGLHHHLAASGNFGQLLRKNYPVCIGHHVNDGAREETSVVGPLCTPLDLLADRMQLGAADVGDLVVVLQSGAYGFSASPHGFLGHPAPLQVLV